MKFVDAKCPNCKGSIKLFPDQKSGKCEYCGAELLIETELTSRIDRAHDLINQGLFLKAAEILNETLLLDSKNGELYFGLLLCDLEAKNPQQLAQAKFDYSSNQNYVKALQFLPSDSKNELLQLCLQNTLYQQQKQTAKQVNNVKSPLVEEFERINVLPDSNGSLTFAYVITDFSTFTDKMVLGFYLKTRDAMRRIIELNETLTAQEKSTMYAFDQVSVNKAIEIFLEIEQIIIEEKNKGTFDDILKPEEPTQEDDHKEDDYQEEEYEDDGYDDDYEEDDDDDDYEEDDDDDDYEEEDDDEDYEDDDYGEELEEDKHQDQDEDIYSVYLVEDGSFDYSKVRSNICGMSIMGGGKVCRNNKIYFVPYFCNGVNNCIFTNNNIVANGRCIDFNNVKRVIREKDIPNFCNGVNNCIFTNNNIVANGRCIDFNNVKRVIREKDIPNFIKDTNTSNTPPKEFKQKSNEELIQEKENERINEIRKRINELEYEKGGLGIFGGKRKKEIKNEICSLNNENTAILIKREIRKIEAKINGINEDIKAANDKHLPIIETAEQELAKTAFTAFKRRSELKSKIKENKSSLKERLKQLNERLKITNKSLEEEKKKLSKLKY